MNATQPVASSTDSTVTFLDAGTDAATDGDPIPGTADHPTSEADDESLIDVPSTFAVDDETSASWVVRKIVEARAHADRVRAWAAAELRRAEQEEAWLLRRFGPALEGWLRAEMDRRGGRRRSVALPPGTLGLRRQPTRLDVVDETTVGAWCQRHLPDAVRVSVEAEGPAAVELAAWQAARFVQSRLKRHILRDPLNRHLAETGELPPGAALRAAGDVFYVK